MPAPHQRARWIALACVAVGVVVLGVAGVSLFARDTPAARPRAASIPVVNTGSIPATTSTSPPASTSRASSATTQPPATPAATGQRAEGPEAVSALEPQGARLTITRLGVDAPIVSVGDSNRTLEVPTDPKVLGWWSKGARPGSGAGSVVIDGHVNYDGVAGALGVLPKLRVGDRITITRGDRHLDYRVSAVRTYVKSGGLPADVFAQNVDERLVLITCGGPFDSSTGNYEDNVVAYATPVAT